MCGRHLQVGQQRCLGGRWLSGLELRAQEEWVWEPVYEEVREESRRKGRGTMAFKVRWKERQVQQPGMWGGGQDPKG